MSTAGPQGVQLGHLEQNVKMELYAILWFMMIWLVCFCAYFLWHSLKWSVFCGGLARWESILCTKEKKN